MAVYQFKSSTSYSGIPNHIIEERQDVIFRRVRGILNKITPETFDKLSKELINVGLDSPRTLRGVIYLLFDKALKDLKYSSLYAKLCQELSEKAPNFEQEPGPNTFCKFLISKCEDEFERRRKATEDFDSKNELTDEEYEQKAIVKQKMLGNIKFICELGKKRLLQEEILHECIRGLLSKKRERPIQDQAQDLECLCQIMRTIGSLLDIKASRNLMNQYFERIDMFSRKSELPSRIRFMLRDVIDLRNNNWRPRPFQREDNVPQTLSKLREEAGYDHNTNTSIDKFGNTRNLAISDIYKLDGYTLAKLLEDEPSFTTSTDYHWGPAFSPNDNPFDAFSSNTKEVNKLQKQQQPQPQHAVFSASANSAFTSINTIAPASNAATTNSSSSLPLANFHNPHPFQYKKDPFSLNHENDVRGIIGFENKQPIKSLDSNTAAKLVGETKKSQEGPSFEKVPFHNTDPLNVRNAIDVTTLNMAKNNVIMVDSPRSYYRDQEQSSLNHRIADEDAGSSRRFIEPSITSRPRNGSPNMELPMRRHQPKRCMRFGRAVENTKYYRRYNPDQLLEDGICGRYNGHWWPSHHNVNDRLLKPESELNFNWRSGRNTLTITQGQAPTAVPAHRQAITTSQVPNTLLPGNITASASLANNNSTTSQQKSSHGPIGSRRQLSPHFKELLVDNRFEASGERASVSNSMNNNNIKFSNPNQISPNQFADSETHKHINSPVEKRSLIDRSKAPIVSAFNRQANDMKEHHINNLTNQQNYMAFQAKRPEKSSSLGRPEEPARESHPYYHGRLSSPNRPILRRRHFEVVQQPSASQNTVQQFDRAYSNHEDSFERKEQQRLPYNKSYFQDNKEHHNQHQQIYRNQESEAHYQERNHKPLVIRNSMSLENSNANELDRIPNWRRVVPAAPSSSTSNCASNSNSNNSASTNRDQLLIIQNPILSKPSTKISDKNFSLRPSHNLLGRFAIQSTESSTAKAELALSEDNQIKEAVEHLASLKINFQSYFKDLDAQLSQQAFISGTNGEKDDENANSTVSSVTKNQASDFHVNKFMSVLAEFCSESTTCNINRIVSKIKELKIPKSYQHECLVSAMKQSILKSEIDRENVGKLFVQIMPSTFDTSALIKAYKLIFEQMKGMEVETPKVKSLVAEFMSRTILDGLISLEEVGSVLSGGKHHPLFLLILQKLEKSAGQSWLNEKFIWSKINLISMLPEVDQSKDRLASILKDRSLGFLDPMLTIEPDLWEQLKERDSSPAAVYRWIKENVDQNIQENPTFAHVLVTCLLKYIHKLASEKAKLAGTDHKDNDSGSSGNATLSESTKSSPSSTTQSTSDFEKEILTKYQQVLQAILKDKQMQLATLYALQAFYYELDFPKGSLLRWFHMLYDMNVVDDDVFFTWKEEINDEVPGKGQALFQVNNWFNWLAEAESEEEEDV